MSEQPAGGQWDWNGHGNLIHYLGGDDSSDADVWQLVGNYDRPADIAQATAGYLNSLEQQLVEASRDLRIAKEGSYEAGEDVDRLEDQLAAAKQALEAADKAFEHQDRMLLVGIRHGKSRFSQLVLEYFKARAALAELDSPS